MKITGAGIQLGEKPPFNVINIPARMKGNMPQIKIGSAWIDFPREGPRPNVTDYMSHPVAGITTTWETSDVQADKD